MLPLEDVTHGIDVRDVGLFVDGWDLTPMCVCVCARCVCVCGVCVHVCVCVWGGGREAALMAKAHSITILS